MKISTWIKCDRRQFKCLAENIEHFTKKLESNVGRQKRKDLIKKNGEIERIYITDETDTHKGINKEVKRHARQQDAQNTGRG